MYCFDEKTITAQELLDHLGIITQYKDKITFNEKTKTLDFPNALARQLRSKKHDRSLPWAFSFDGFSDLADLYVVHRKPVDYFEIDIKSPRHRRVDTYFEQITPLFSFEVFVTIVNGVQRRQNGTYYLRLNENVGASVIRAFCDAFPDPEEEAMIPFI